ncbi:MAG: multiple monosaccharide ABC transporter permease [Candidatus Limiplasma sp.]|nr:multiple monosaccharide ABC transporter permease [Candidatus Limiplasma sp.]
MGELKNLLKSNMRQYTMILVLAGLTLFFQISTKGILLLPQNVSNLVQQNAYVVILAVGMMICIISGGNVDLSVGSVVAFIGATCATLMIGKDMNVFLVILICTGVALLAGAWHGFWISRFSIPSFIATLSGMLVFRGLTYFVLRGETYFSYPESFLAFTTGFLKDYLGGPDAKIHVTTLVVGAVLSALFVVLEIRKRAQKQRYQLKVLSVPFFVAKQVFLTGVIMAFAYLIASYKGMPIIMIPVAIVIVVYSFILNNTVMGRYVYALGGNQKSAQLSGINVKKVLFLCFVNMAFLAAIAGLMFTARLNSASPKAGEGFELDAIAACYIGGASASGGVGSIIGALIGALVMGLLNNGMSIMGVGIELQMAVKGLVLLMAVVLDMVQKQKAKG